MDSPIEHESRKFHIFPFSPSISCMS
jgi:hypothetical protein